MRKEKDRLEIDGTLNISYDGDRYTITFYSPHPKVGSMNLGHFASAPECIKKEFEL